MNPLNIRLSRYVLPMLFLFGMGHQQSVYARDNLRQDVRITLTVLAPTCSIRTEEKNIQVDFGNVLNSDLYLKHRTEGRQFELNLKDCDPRMIKRLKIKFLGEPSQELPGLLAVRSNGSLRGIAIGMEKIDGTPMPFNKTSEFPLLANSTENVIPFRAYIQAAPRVIQEKKMGVGQFTAIATFEVNYD
ncbi:MULTISPECIES: fimbrial protein [Xenorhabdus]|uniref:Fimbrial adaptor, MrxG n=1 Tax=Xenorhabdus doucetiae TaxID=351671 RepID=A0A068QP77_9GAMM|nr:MULTISPECIES: fimbrial protein [Xenorhabdus]MBD2796470.1 type 1 fimbrial protein [Xenorhabdus sp. 18]MDC9581112.1 fimbrial protein [Xenorhabdus sp. PR6a]TYP16649.1 type 1 fimbria pilin [Xenorhabdus doucetiae]CDG16441.1 fimbrial adaptor, MrxG [Xenorhabdus doucetiae]